MKVRQFGSSENYFLLTIDYCCIHPIHTNMLPMSRFVASMKDLKHEIGNFSRSPGETEKLSSFFQSMTCELCREI